jgi:putative inorganic carbon (hco3(-)) transporter
MYLIWIDLAYLTLASLGFIAVFAAIFYTEYAFLALAFLTPLSVNIEEYTDSFGLFIPTEPLLFGLMLLFLMINLRKRIYDVNIWKNPIIWAVSFYIGWIFITSITSSLPLVSFKFLLARLWFIIPMLFLGSIVFQKEVNIKRFLWLYAIGMMIAIAYTLVVHASYGFGEKESHWVMWPFFKDHTIYGAMVAFNLPILVGLYLSKKHSPLVQAVLISFIVLNLVGLYFSYTRAAWLSVIAALGVLGLIYFRIKFSLLVYVTLFLGAILFFSWDSIQMELARNKSEHTTEEFGKRLESAANVTTDASNLERLNRWSCALQMFEERPIVGFGPGTYAFQYARFQEPENTTIISTNFGDAGNAHSEYLGPLSEMGVFGLLSMIFIVSAIFYKGIMLYLNWPAEQSEMKVLILSMVLALVTYFVHAFLNNYLDTDKAAVPIWGFCAAFIAMEMKLASNTSINRELKQ